MTDDRQYTLYSAALVTASFVTMTPLAEGPLKMLLLVLCGLLLAMPPYGARRIFRQHYIWFSFACTAAYAHSIIVGIHQPIHIAVYGTIAVIPAIVAGSDRAPQLLNTCLAFCALAFIPDLLTNILAAQGLLTREVEITQRAGDVVNRYGGLFGHTFVSGIISLLAYAWALTKLPDKPNTAIPFALFCTLLAAWNTDMAGSRRHTLLVGIVGAVYVISLLRRPRIAFLLAFVAVLYIFGYEILFIGEDEGNQLRAIVWLKAIGLIQENPVFGIGFGMPGTTVEDFNPLDEYLTESFFLTVGISGGVATLAIFAWTTLSPIVKSGNAALQFSIPSNRHTAAIYALYCAILLEFLFGGIMPSLFGAIFFGALYANISTRDPRLLRH